MASEAVGAIVGGCVAGGVVLIIVLSVVLYLLCGKRKHRNKREQKKFRPLTPHVSPTHSQPSTLGHERLPKVNSTGLWIGTPSIYSGAPSQAYYYGRPHGSSKHRIEQPLNIQRAASETRIPQPRQGYVPSRPYFGSHNNVYIMPVHGGQRIYHSQPLAPLYEVPPMAAPSYAHGQGMEIYDVYQFGGGAGGSRSKLIETKHSPYYYNDYSEYRVSSKLERSKSDAQDRRTPRSDFSRPVSKPGQRSSSQESKGRHSRDNSTSQKSFASDEKVRKVSKSMESLKGGGGQKSTYEDVRIGHINVAYSPDVRKAKAAPKPPPATSKAEVTKTVVQNGTPTVPTTEVISPSATDSMKLLAKNKTDDQKTQPNFSSVMVEKDIDVTTNDGKDVGFKHFKYQEDIYTVPNKNGVISEGDDYDNPIINRMKEMVIEKSRHGQPPTPRGDSVDPYEVVSSTTVTKTSAENAGIYEEVTKVTKVTKTEVTQSYETVPDTENSGNDALDGLVLPDNLEVDNDQSEDLPRKPSLPVSEGATTTQTLSVPTENANRPPSPAGSRHKKDLSPRPSVDMDGAGKITASAFEFLDNYLEDDDGDSHVESPPLSPGPMRVEGVVN